MALDGDIMGASVDTAVKAITTAPEDPAYSLEVWQEACKKIVAHITANLKIEIPENSNTGITASGGITTPAVIASQGKNPSQDVGNGDGNIT